MNICRHIFVCFSIALLGMSSAFGKLQEPDLDSLSKAYETCTTDTTRLYLLTELASGYRIKNVQRAEKYANEALALALKLGEEKKIAGIYNTLGNIMRDKAKFTESMDFYLKAIKLKEQFGDKKGISSGLINISNIHYYLGNKEKAVTYLKQALALKKELNDQKGIAGCLNNLGNFFYTDTLGDSAYYYFSESLKIREKLQDRQGISANLANMAGALVMMKKPLEAVKMFEKAIALKRDVGDSIGMVTCLINAGHAYKDIGQFETSKKYYLESMAIAELFEAKEDLSNVYSGLAELHFQQHSFREAYQFLEKHVKLNHELFNDGMAQAQAEMSTKYETEKKEKEIELLNKDKLVQESVIKEEKAYRNLTLSVGGLVTILSGVLFFAFKQKQKNNILLTRQKEEIEEKNNILTIQKEEIAFQKKEITDSITYAKRIQESILPPESEILRHFSEGFVYYKPKDIVSGDFFWASTQNDDVLIAAADCTGHGVPGALMSMIGAEKLFELSSIESDPGALLKKLNKKVRSALKQDKDSGRSSDGMDIALVRYDKGSGKIVFAGANRPLWLIRKDGSFSEIRGTKSSIGGSTDSDQEFQSVEIALNAGDSFYLFSDGYQDQFGGKEGKKLMKKHLREVIEKNQGLSMNQQKEKLDDFFQDWKGNHEQVDDVMMIGLKV